MRTRILAALALFAISSHALAEESRSGDFITAAIEGNAFEVKAGELAQKQGASAGVREFGAMLAKDHAQAHDKSVKAAQSTGARVAAGPSATQRSFSRVSRSSRAIVSTSASSRACSMITCATSHVTRRKRSRVATPCRSTPPRHYRRCAII